MQGARIFRNEVYLQYVGMTKDESQRSPSTLLRAVSLSNGRWTFYEVVKYCLNDIFVMLRFIF